MCVGVGFCRQRIVRKSLCVAVKVFVHGGNSTGKSMARICFITGKKRVIGSRISRKGQSKKSGGIGTHVTKKWPRIFKPNLQRVRVKLPNGQVRRVWVAVKAIKAGLVEKVVS